MVSSQTASQSEMDASRVPLGWRDQCSALLIPLNKCRHKTLYAPWACEDESYMRRMKQLSAQKKAAAEADEE
ncbi:hypothetical protein QFC20_004010 [Naganishia adeliensis]|uniref:Uncharacterized protein n=1 Tax=Naganishia adeliensis TaxID=92952 RepID=A0ACC2W641_9TREE|nr:hypothetical protein QFC20_004010 [Naganishia adeliensis]